MFWKALPNIAIVCESAVYIYKNMKPYFKFVLPSSEIPKEEAEIWTNFADIETLAPFLQNLNKLKAEGFQLSYKSNDILSCQSVEEQKKLLISYKNLQNLPNMPTCVQVIKKEAEEEYALSNLIIGTEMRTVLILDNQGTSIIKKMMLPSIPVVIIAHGLLEEQYKLIVGCRDDKIYFIRNGEVRRIIYFGFISVCWIGRKNYD